MLKIVLFFLFCAISGYGINGHPNGANDSSQLENKAVPQVVAATSLNDTSLNSHQNGTSVSPQQVSSSPSVSISDTTVTEAGTNIAVSNTASTKENSASMKTVTVEHASINAQTNNSLPMAAENPSETVIDNSHIPSTSTGSPITFTSPVRTQKIVPVPVTTTEAPIEPVPAPKAGKWIVNETNQTCIIVNMAVQFNVSYTDKENKTISKLFNLPDSDDKTVATGKCEKLEQYITLSWNDDKNVTYNFTIHFTKNETINQYSLHHLEVVMLLDPNNTVVLVHNTPLVSTELSSSYRCLKQQNFTLAQNGTDKTMGYFSMSDLQFQAFKTDNTKNFGQVKDCRLDTPDIVPIAVGCALAGLVVIVLIAYLMGRKRSQARGYFSM